MRVFGIRLFEKKIIGPVDNPLLIRHILFRIPQFGIYLHHLLRSDFDRALHNHPFPFLSVILKGEYLEHHNQTIDGTEVAERRPRWSVLLRPAEWRHRLEMAEPVWTLVLVGRRTQPWGFFLPEGWCWWRQHNSELNICEDHILFTEGSD